MLRRVANSTWRLYANSCTARCASKALRSDTPLEPRTFGETSKRTGVIAVKAGMTQEWDSLGVFVPLTVLWIDHCQVTRVRKKENGEVRLQLGCGYDKEKNATRAQKQLAQELGMPIKRKLEEFKISEDAILPVGTEVKASHFMAGQYVDVKGTTIGKGFQGVMKRWGFAGGNASHGASKSHRTPGSIGACQDPGKVWKGKKMPGRMGGKIRMVHSVRVHKVDAERNLIYVRGQVPGHRGNFVMLRDARLKPHNPNLPFPTHIGPPPPITTAEPEKDPYHQFQKGRV